MQLSADCIVTAHLVNADQLGFDVGALTIIRGGVRGRRIVDLA